MRSQYVETQLSEIRATHAAERARNRREAEAWLLEHSAALKRANAARIYPCVYVIPAREFVKIGVAVNPERRWKNLLCANPLIEPLLYVSRRLLWAYPCETAIHTALAQYRVVKDARGAAREWFECDRGMAVEVTKQTIEKVLAERADNKADIMTRYGL